MQVGQWIKVTGKTKGGADVQHIGKIVEVGPHGLYYSLFGKDERFFLKREGGPCEYVKIYVDESTGLELPAEELGAEELITETVATTPVQPVAPKSDEEVELEKATRPSIDEQLETSDEAVAGDETPQ